MRAAGRSEAGEGAGGAVVPPLGIALIVAVALAWGLNWPAMKVALGEFPPLTFRILTIAIASTLLLSLSAARGERARLPLRDLPWVALIALPAVTGWQLFSALGLLYVGSGKAAIIAFTMPLWATMLSVWLLGERLSWRHGVALVLGGGALALLLGEDLAVVGASPVGGLLMTAAAICWAIGTVLVKKLQIRMPVMPFTAWQMLLGALPMAAAWPLLEQAPDFAAITPRAWFAFLFTALIGTVVGITSYYRLVRLVPASIAATATLTVPVIGVIASALLLAEPVGLHELVALVLVVAALAVLVRGNRDQPARASSA
jgi:drug/metabolite transporter (DMT)-like permease